MSIGYVCSFVCPLAKLKNTRLNFFEIFVHVAYGPDSIGHILICVVIGLLYVLLPQGCCHTLFTSGFADDIMFLYNGPIWRIM